MSRALPWWDIPAAPLSRGMRAHLRYGDGVIMWATYTGTTWRVDWCGSYRTLNDAAAQRGFPPDTTGRDAERAAADARTLGSAS